MPVSIGPLPSSLYFIHRTDVVLTTLTYFCYTLWYTGGTRKEMEIIASTRKKKILVISFVSFFIVLTIVLAFLLSEMLMLLLIFPMVGRLVTGLVGIGVEREDE